MSACILCRRPKWDGSSVYDMAMCAADTPGPNQDLADCRSHALSVAAMVAPVVETVGYWLDSADYSDGPGKFGAQVAHNYDAMRDGLRKLGGGL